jgi:hypothetical protein
MLALSAAVIAVQSAGDIAFAEAIRVQASVSRNRVPLDGQIELRLQIEGTQKAQAPDLRVPGFDVHYLGPFTQFSSINGVVSSSVAHRYALLPQQEGRFTIPPISFIIDGKSFTTEPIEVEVVPAAAHLVPGPSGQLDGDVDAAEPGQILQFSISVEKPTVYLNEPLQGRLQLLIGGVMVRGVEPPVLSADGFLVKLLKEPTQSDVMIDGQPQTLLDFEITAIPIRPGTLELGPASIVCQVAMRQRPSRRRHPFGADPFEGLFGDSFVEDFFGTVRTRPVTLRAAPAIMEVLPLPEEGRPAGFSGALGRFTMDVRAVPAEVTAGEPVTITTTIEGSGNFDTVSAPSLGGDLSRFKVYDPQMQKPASDEERARRRVFEQVVIPLEAGTVPLPAASLSFFDPQARRYETLTSGPLLLTVKPAASPQAVTIVDQPRAGVTPAAAEPEALGRDLIYIKASAGELRAANGPAPISGPFWLALLTPLGLLGLSEAWRRWRMRLAADPSIQRASGAMKRAMAQCQQALRLQRDGKVAECYAQIFRTLQRYIGDRFGLSGEGMTKVELAQHLRGRGIPDPLIQELAEVFDRCDAARFAPISVAADQVGATLESVMALLKQLERYRPG